jgi:hypothetical protein
MWMEVIGKAIIVLFVVGLVLKFLKGIFRTVIILACIGALIYLFNKGIDLAVISAHIDAGKEMTKVLDQEKDKFPGVFGWIEESWYKIKLNLGL